MVRARGRSGAARQDRRHDRQPAGDHRARGGVLHDPRRPADDRPREWRAGLSVADRRTAATRRSPHGGAGRQDGAAQLPPCLRDRREGDGRTQMGRLAGRGWGACPGRESGQASCEDRQPDASDPVGTPAQLWRGAQRLCAGRSDPCLHSPRRCAGRRGAASRRRQRQPRREERRARRQGRHRRRQALRGAGGDRAVRRSRPFLVLAGIHAASLPCAALAAGLDAARPAASAPERTEWETLLLAVMLNSARTGVLLTVLKLPDKSLLARASELRALRVQVDPRMVKDDLVALSAIPGLGFAYDEPSQTIALTIGEQSLDPYRIELGTGRRAFDAGQLRSTPGAIVNYAIYATQTRERTAVAGTAVSGA
ncbi:hypothetical protein DdX_21049 [Ditylenchus destructor]|uniref:Uncharacterized protein n=1 Tax=Ditylenchus destructor TaxID=166010 RepID=A0AAD4QW12_9BILA|nr:hypothetical protein DdX_21049 [Ditylenchus destructor]